jgi:glycosyltransferase involved in cell wall biosynthesis
MHDLPPGRRARIVPGKTYEYLASGRPILAAVPDGDARDLVQAADRVELCRPADAEGMAAAIARELDRPAADRSRPADRRSLIAPYERRALARRLAAVFDAVLEAADAKRLGRGREAAPPESRAVG